MVPFEYAEFPEGTIYLTRSRLKKPQVGQTRILRAAVLISCSRLPPPADQLDTETRHARHLFWIFVCIAERERRVYARVSLAGHRTTILPPFDGAEGARFEHGVPVVHF